VRTAALLLRVAAGCPSAVEPGGGGDGGSSSGAVTTGTGTGTGTAAGTGTATGTGSGTAAADVGNGPETGTTTAGGGAMCEGKVGCEQVVGDETCGPAKKCVFCRCAESGAFATACVSSGTIPVGEPCGSTPLACGAQQDPCVPEAACVFGYCYPRCLRSPNDPAGVTCADPQAVCHVTGDLSPSVCTIPCDPTDPQGTPCPDGLGCKLRDAGGYSLACLPRQFGRWQEVVGYGEVCDGPVTICDFGLHCVAAGAFPPGMCAGDACCTTFCDHTEPAGSEQCPQAADGQVCVDAFGGALPPWQQHVGLCMVP